MATLVTESHGIARPGALNCRVEGTQVVGRPETSDVRARRSFEIAPQLTPMPEDHAVDYFAVLEHLSVTTRTANGSHAGNRYGARRTQSRLADCLRPTS